MKPSVYIETTIPSYLAARPSRDLIRAAHQQITRDWWDRSRDRFELLVSQAVLDECAAGDPVAAAARRNLIDGLRVLVPSDRSLRLAGLLVERLKLPRKAGIDALHIATAAVEHADYLLTWNCRHIANATFFPMIREACLIEGCEVPTICTPDQLQGER